MVRHSRTWGPSVDSARYGATNLQTLGQTRWLTRVPATLAEAKQVLAETDRSQMTELPDGYAYCELVSDYAQIAQRWLVVYSPSAAEREGKTLQRRVAKEEAEARKAWRQLVSQTFNCQTDAHKALAGFQKRWKYHRAEAKATALTRYSGPGRPAAGIKPEVVGYQLQGQVLVSRRDPSHRPPTLGPLSAGHQPVGPGQAAGGGHGVPVQGTRRFYRARFPLPGGFALLRRQPLPQETRTPYDPDHDHGACSDHLRLEDSRPVGRSRRSRWASDHVGY